MTDKRNNLPARNSVPKSPDDLVISDFVKRFGKPTIAPVAIVIAAYKEKDNIGAVLKSLPKQLGGLGVSVIVVVDGDDDGTEAIARKNGAVALTGPFHRGQGASLKLGYRLARENGAKYIITGDADGQTNPAELESVLQPVINDEADFVNGSRRLGNNHSTSLLRNIGITVFGKAASQLTGTKVTDTANSVRAMRADLTKTIQLDEPQYQAPEILLTVIMRGARYAERGVSVNPRLSGRSKKGLNFSYGYNYAKVFIKTWRREYLISREAKKS